MDDRKNSLGFLSSLSQMVKISKGDQFFEYDQPFPPPPLILHFGCFAIVFSLSLVLCFEQIYQQVPSASHLFTGIDIAYMQGEPCSCNCLRSLEDSLLATQLVKHSIEKCETRKEYNWGF